MSTPAFAIPQASAIFLSDVIGALVAITGVSIMVVTPPGAASGPSVARLPAGVDIVIVRDLLTDPGALARQAFHRHFARDDSPVLVIASDTIGCGVRNAATALSTLKLADAAIGLTFAGGVYAVGAKSAEAAAALDAQGWLNALETGGAAPISLPGPPIVVSRSLARLHRGRDCATVEELRLVISSAPTPMPRIAAALGLPSQ